MKGQKDNTAQNILEDINNEYKTIFPQYKDELNSILTKNTNLFPKNWTLDKDTTETYRALCILSQSALTSVNSISSHRKIIGPVIVFFKKIIWKILDSQLKKSFVGVSSCLSHLIANQAKLEAKIKDLEKIQMGQ